MTAARISQTSSGNLNLNSASKCANSASERPGCTSMPELWSWVITLSSTEENENNPLRSRKEEEDEDVVARVNNRHRPDT
ncbi:hypothetical protein L195_g000580 [Trifolium pratense]|uniref:Uncharacterized protein n=1 Tax=Trifolium pratense TaxID=57577 RepID=A0A2K3NMA4_TRIPR|nr:hypothetical protein L195_g000580 [Trifolium pratense]